MKLFGTTILIGALVTVVGSVCIQLFNPDFRDVEAIGWLMYLLMMALAGMMFGAFAHMGFFAYLMLNYIARSVLKRPYYWVAIQAFVALFVLIEIAFWTYGSDYPAATFWVLPLALLVGSLLIAWLKASQTSAGAWIPTVFFMIGMTVLESIPAFRIWDIWSLSYQLIPLFVCNAYQIMQLHKILAKPAAAAPAAAALSK